MSKLNESESSESNTLGKQSKPSVSAIQEKIFKAVQGLVDALPNDSVKRIQNLCSKIQSHHIAATIALGIVFFAVIAMQRGINTEQLQQIQRLAIQTEYKHTQALAFDVLELPQADIRQKHWLKLNAAWQHEQNAIYRYEPMHFAEPKSSFEYPNP